MKWIAVKVLFEFQDVALAADLIADCFYTVGLKGVVIDDPVADPDEDWAHAWKAFFYPERVGRHIVVKPTWRDYTPQPGDKVLEIDPGMAFDTGTHPTTSLCIGLMEKHLRPGGSFLDVGTGSGILMAAAAKLEAGRGLGIDNDPLAVEIAGNNLRLNGADPEKFTVATGDLVSVVTGSYDLVAANILSEVIVRLLDDLPEKTTPGGIVITSGIIEKNQAVSG